MSASTFSRSSKELMNSDANTPADLTCGKKLASAGAWHARSYFRRTSEASGMAITHGTR